MDLKKQPETEMEYWQAIEGLGGIAWRLNHDLADGGINDADGSADKTIREATELSTKLVSELSEKFGVIPPQDCPKLEIGEKSPKPPKGKQYYWDWYDRMKRVFYKIEYEKTICSACPFSKRVKSIGRTIPCDIFPGVIYQLYYPYQCGMIDVREWNEDKLREKLLKKGGEVAFTKFKIKEAGLKALYDSRTGGISIPQ